MGKVAIIGCPLDLGGNRRGVDMGPSALRLTHLVSRLKQLGYDVVDTGDVDVPLPEECHLGDPHMKYAKEIGEVCQSLCDRVVKGITGSADLAREKVGQGNGRHRYLSL